MRYFQIVRSTFYDPDFYSGARKETLSNAIKLFAVLGVIGTAITMLVAFSGLIPFALSNLPDQVEAAYPDDLVVKISDGKMTVNKPQPYYVANTIASTTDLKYIAIFDGTDQLQPDLAANSTFILLKDKYAIMPGQNHSQQVIPYSRIGTTTIQKSTVTGFIDKYKPYFVPAVLGGGAVTFLLFCLFGTLFWVIFHMIYVLVPALLVFGFSALRKLKLSYKESYMITLYATVPVAIIVFVLDLVGLGVVVPKFSYSLLVLVFVLINISKIQKSQN